ncbi:hypothetical protein HGRIS_014417 [Hohenbuehelia grisea]|uniref:Protein kinase domain-containing protein n=1 Tax=Hohenbuehelia grisea TaxID=104357 RepID=A0ABR3JV40_9AGAR
MDAALGNSIMVQTPTLVPDTTLRATNPRLRFHTFSGTSMDRLWPLPRPASLKNLQDEALETGTRQMPSGLPQLSIPPSLPAVVIESPETPASLSSPVVGVVDLTKRIRTRSKDPLMHGGFSDIYMGEWEQDAFASNDGELGASAELKLVAIKLLRVLSRQDQDGVKARKRLNREVYVWHRLDHPHIARFYGTSYHMSGRPAMIMQWYKNGSASDYLARNPEADRLSLIRDAARGLTYLHTLTPPIVHGDLKGNNILITDDGRAALSDFGLSQVIEDLMGPTGFTPSCPEGGPVRWQAPEFIQDETWRPRLSADVWSFGCTAYELLTGKIPFPHRRRDGPVIQDLIAGAKPTAPGEIIDAPIKDLLDSCWRFEAEERPTMPEIVARLEELCTHP